MSFDGGWNINYLSIESEVRTDPSNPLAMQKRGHAVLERWKIGDAAPANAVGSTANTLDFSVGTNSYSQSPVTGATLWYCVSMQREYVQEGAYWARTIERWESWQGDGDEDGWSTFTVV